MSEAPPSTSIGALLQKRIHRGSAKLFLCYNAKTGSKSRAAVPDPAGSSAPGLAEWSNAMKLECLYCEVIYVIFGKNDNYCKLRLRPGVGRLHRGTTEESGQCCQ